MNRFEKILNDHLQELTESEINVILKKIEHFDESTPWTFYLKFITVFIIFVTSVNGLINKNNKDSYNRKEPFNIRVGYLLWGIGGLFGFHHTYLQHKKQGTIYSILLLAFICLNVPFFAIYLYFPQVVFDLGSYHWTSIILLSTLLLLWIKDAVLMPYYCYKQNNDIYKKHFETDLIIGGKNNTVDLHIKERDEIVTAIKTTDVKIHEILNDESVIDTDGLAISSFFKSVITLGKSSKLEKEVGRLKALQTVALSTRDQLTTTIDYHNYAEDLLERCRIDAYRNLSLAKEMIAIIKHIKGKDNKLITDQILHIEIEALAPVDDNVVIEAFEDNRFVNKIQDNFTKGLDKFVSGKVEINKGTLVDQGVDLAIHVIEDFISEIGRLNKEVSQKRLEVQRAKNDIERSLLSSSKAFIGLQANIFRINEIVEGLDQVNKLFICRYEPLRLRVFEDSSLSSFLKQKSRYQMLKTDPLFWADIKLLVSICTEYNKINQSKVI